MVYEWKRLAAAVSLWLWEEIDVAGGALDSAGTVAGESPVISQWLKQDPSKVIQYVTQITSFTLCSLGLIGQERLGLSLCDIIQSI